MAVHELQIQPAEQKRLQAHFDDKKIVYGWHPRRHRYEVWYKPSSSRPYMVCTAVNVCHALKQLQTRSENQRRRAIDVLRDIDAHNEQLLDKKQADVMSVVRSELRQIASGKQHFIAR